MPVLLHMRPARHPSTCPATIAYEGVAVHGSSASEVWVAGMDYSNPTWALARWTGSSYTRHDNSSVASYYAGSSGRGGDLYVADSTHVWLLTAENVWFWNGSTWSSVLSHYVGQGAFKALVGFSSSDVYAWFDLDGTGGYPPGIGYYHWNGTTWSSLTSVATGGLSLTSVHGTGSSTQRGAGTYIPASDYAYYQARISLLGTDTYTVEYTGAARTTLHDLYTPDSTHGIAVGAQNLDDSTPGAYTADPLILALSSGTWTALTAPSYATPARFTAVGGTSSTDVWIAVTQFVTGDIYTTGDLHMLHYDGSTFAHYPLPGFSDAGLYGWLDRVWAVSSTDVWVTGVVGCGTYDLHLYTVHWNGTTWTERPIT